MSTNIILKSQLTEQQLAIVEEEMERKSKSKLTAYLFWFFLGIFGVHRFYIGDVRKGRLLLFTFGGLVIGAFIDVFSIGKSVELVNKEIEATIIQEAKKVKCFKKAPPRSAVALGGGQGLR